MINIPKSLRSIFDKDNESFFQNFEESDLAYIDPSGRNLLSNAIIEGLSSVVVFLVKYKHLLDSTDKKGLKPLHHSVLKNDIKISSILLENGASIDATDNFGNTALWRAVFQVKMKHYEMVDFLVKEGATVDIKNNNNISPLDFAEKIGDKKLVTILNQDSKNHPKKL